MARGGKRTAAAGSRTLRSNSSQGPTKRVTHDRSETRKAPLPVQQRCLGIFRDALQPDVNNDHDMLQAIKGHLYNRNFSAAFGRQEHLNVYASRWSPSRALGYLDLLLHLQHYLLVPLDSDNGAGARDVGVACIGGGPGAEVVAFAGWQHILHEDKQNVRITAKCLDIAAWSNITASLCEAATNPPKLSQYASTANKAESVALVSKETFKVDFEQLDILTANEAERATLFQTVDLVTLMFTLNELYTTSVPKTQQMLAMLTTSLRPGSHLLVVDSPGSYSTVSINGTDRKYPMSWLLDYTLIGARDVEKATKDERALWEKVAVDESRWFRLPPGLQYPIGLENMRYQMHLYKRLPTPPHDS